MQNNSVYMEKIVHRKTMCQSVIFRILTCVCKWTQLK
jgi:hypothetical protein